MANRGAGKSFPVQEGRREHLQVVFPKQADDQVGVRIHDVETRDKGSHVAHPDAVHVGVRDGDNMVVVDAFRVERPLDHLVTLAQSEEHTSELQSLTNIVCRLLLEKKKQRTSTFKS